jgi:hypothetical protein
METVSRVEAGFWEQFETFQSVSVDLARFSDQVVERALELALELTGSSAAFIALADDTGGRKQVYSLPGHLGLLALNERALLTGGWCKISSAPDKGCRVGFWFPVPA